MVNELVHAMAMGVSKRTVTCFFEGYKNKRDAQSQFAHNWARKRMDEEWVAMGPIIQSIPQL